MKHGTVLIGDINVPIVFYEEEQWFPISFITKKVLLRKSKTILTTHKKGLLWKVLPIKFGESNIQETKCTTKHGLIELLSTTKIGWLSSEQRVSQNKLHLFLDIEPLPEVDQDVSIYDESHLEKFNAQTRSIILYEINNVPDCLYRMCSKCFNYLPLTSRFFITNNTTGIRGYSKVCKFCSGRGNSCFKINKVEKVPNTYNFTEQISQESLINIYNQYLKGAIKNFPDCYKNKESYLKIVSYLHKEGVVSEKNLTIHELIKSFGLNDMYSLLSTDDLYEELFGKEFYYFSWKYPKYSFKGRGLTYEIANRILHNYIECNNLTIVNKFTFDYDPIFKECKIHSLTSKNKLYFLVQFYQFKYAGYQFKASVSSYYRNESNILFDLKYLIELDLKININEIPSQLTENRIRKKCSRFYYYLFVNNNYKLFEFVNKIYPEKFTTEEFEYRVRKDEFDSEDEFFINGILKDNFENVIYNQRNEEETLYISKMIPDWFIIRDEGVWIVEYFGMYIPDRANYKVIKSYISKTNVKLEKYNLLSGYKFLFLYPDDTLDDYKGVKDKINKMKEDKNYTML